MQFYTSYFAQMRKFPPNLVGLSTAHWEPKWLRPHRSQNGIIWLPIPSLKPGSGCANLCDGKCSIRTAPSCAFLQAYYNQLRQLDMQKFLQEAERLRRVITKQEGFSDIDFAILVYEKPNNPCSERTIIQKWFAENNVSIKEWSD